jgi:hypothetical protein
MHSQPRPKAAHSDRDEIRDVDSDPIAARASIPDIVFTGMVNRLASCGGARDPKSALTPAPRSRSS